MAKKRKAPRKAFKWVSAGAKVRVRTKSGIRKVRPLKKVRTKRRK